MVLVPSSMSLLVSFRRIVELLVECRIQKKVLRRGMRVSKEAMTGLGAVPVVVVVLTTQTTRHKVTTSNKRKRNTVNNPTNTTLNSWTHKNKKSICMVHMNRQRDHCPQNYIHTSYNKRGIFEMRRIRQISNKKRETEGWKRKGKMIMGQFGIGGNKEKRRKKA